MTCLWKAFTSHISKCHLSDTSKAIPAIIHSVRHGVNNNSTTCRKYFHGSCVRVCSNNNEGSYQEPTEMPRVELGKMTQEERDIHFIHDNACKAGLNTYIDPATGYTVLTRIFHIKKGECCGNACRHCPYNHLAVPEEHRTKRFNSSFYI